MALAVALSTTSFAHDAGAVDELEVAGKAGYLTSPIQGGTTPFGAGFGGRIGLALSSFYLGVSVVDYLGGSDVTLSDHALLYGLEVGFGAHVASLGSSTLSLRAQVGVGDAAIMHTDPALAKVDIVTTASGTRSSTSSDTVTVNNVYFEPSLMLMLNAPSHFFGLSASALVVPGISYSGGEPETWLSFGLQTQLGVHF
ncbi:MAG: hypothetical protein ACHREM_02995 [Polyangiales bacterium]